MDRTTRLAGKRTLILGGGGAGIGRGLSERFAREGAVVAVADVDSARADAAVAAISEAGGSALALVGDVRDADQLAAIFDQAVEFLGGLDTVVTVVGGQVAFVPSALSHEISDADWDTMYELNLRYVARAARKAVQIFRAQGEPASVVSVGSVAGLMAAPHQAGYGVMKAGLLSLSRTVAAENADRGIRMNVVVAGAIATAVANDDPGDAWIDEIPMGRHGSVADVAHAAVYLASDEASYVTGQGLVVDGGVSVRGPFG